MNVLPDAANRECALNLIIVHRLAIWIQIVEQIAALLDIAAPIIYAMEEKLMEMYVMTDRNARLAIVILGTQTNNQWNNKIKVIKWTKH